MVDKPVPVYLKKDVDLPLEIESVHGKERLKMGWGLNKSVFPFLNALFLVGCVEA